MSRLFASLGCLTDHPSDHIILSTAFCRTLKTCQHSPRYYCVWAVCTTACCRLHLATTHPLLTTQYNQILVSQEFNILRPGSSLTKLDLLCCFSQFLSSFDAILALVSSIKEFSKLVNTSSLRYYCLLLRRPPAHLNHLLNTQLVVCVITVDPGIY